MENKKRLANGVSHRKLINQVGYFSLKDCDGIQTATYLIKNCNSLARFNKAIHGYEVEELDI